MKGIDKTFLTWALILGVALSAILLMGQDCFAQTGLCDPDPCQSIPNAIAGTCMEVGGGACTGASDYICSCDSGYTWQGATNTCKKCDGIVDFPDSILEQDIRHTISKPTGDIYATDLAGLTELYEAPRPLFPPVISDLSGLECCTALIELDLGYNIIVDVSPLSGLINLTGLNLESNQIVNVSPLAGLTNLTGLYLYYNQIVDVSPLAGLTNLTGLGLVVNQIVDVSPLAGLTNLTGLYLWDNQIVDVSPLAGLTNLTDLSLSSNEIVDVSPLAGLINLTWLYLEDNQIVDMCPLVGNPGLDSGDFVSLASNPLSTTSCTVCIPQLEGRGVSVFNDCP